MERLAATRFALNPFICNSIAYTMDLTKLTEHAMMKAWASIANPMLTRILE